MKRWILWDFERTTWQYDLLCLLIIAFIFLTPQEWYSPNKRATDRPPAAVQVPDRLESPR
ncbi:MAG: hypothetical protein LC113_02480 [Acidobacteria bacterium]|nr:hypothetical protein [Acidobacteriota bacterium]